MKAKPTFEFDRGALSQIVRVELKAMIGREVRKLIRKTFDEELEGIVHKAIWGPIKDARKDYYQAQKRRKKKCRFLRLEDVAFYVESKKTMPHSTVRTLGSPSEADFPVFSLGRVIDFFSQ